VTLDRNRLNMADEDVLMEAAHWLGRAREGLSESERRAFRAWLDERKEHVAAADAVAGAWTVAPGAARRIGLAPPSRTARRRVQSEGYRVGWFSAGWQLAVACLALPLLCFGTWWLMGTQRFDYATGGTQRMIASLPDGSTVWLAPRSRLTGRFDPFGRHVWLREGEATLQVAHRDVAFDVEVGTVRIIDRGTLFDVRKRNADPVSIMLAEGRIEVRDRATGKMLAVPAPGERVTIQGGIASTDRVNAEAALAWRDGRLVFDDCPLSTALAEFAEQGGPSVVLRGAGLERIRISGAFATGSVESFLSALAELHPVTWRRTAQGYEIRRR
jgi:transmembrane sensor